MRVNLERDDDAIASGLLQSRFWAEFKARHGWSWKRFSVDIEAGGSAFALSVLERRLAPGLSFAYAPKGPDADVEPERRGELLSALGEALAPLVSPTCAFIRFDPPWFVAEAPAERADGAAQVPPRPRPAFVKPLIKGSDVQPPDSVVVDISADDDALLAAMKPKWRYNVRLALKKGVAVASEGAGALDEFYSMYETTARRDSIGIHPKSYYEALLASSASREPGSPDLRLWVARSGGKALAGIVTAFYGSEATYLYGASSDEGRELMPAYALQWAAMRAARDAGIASYDLYGIPPNDDPSHPMAGLYRFKTGFGGEIRHYAGAWDYPLKPAPYAAYRAAEGARLFWHKRVRKALGR